MMGLTDPLWAPVRSLNIRASFRLSNALNCTVAATGVQTVFALGPCRDCRQFFRATRRKGLQLPNCSGF